ncbi:MAG: methionyl-tRNA formyltransferase, partial [Sphingomonadales bacterium]
LGLDGAVVVAYGLILPRAILDAPRLGCFNVHASLLPRWRGAAPIQRAIMAGDPQTGVAIMKMDEGLDTGPVLSMDQTPIHNDDTAGTLHDRLSAMGAALLVPALEAHAAGRLDPVPQLAEGVTYAAKIDKPEARIDWTRSSDELALLVRAMAPYPGAWCSLRGTRIKVLSAAPANNKSGVEPGTVIGAPFRVQCGTGALDLRVLQRAGKGAMDIDAFLRGFPVEIGDCMDNPATGD